MGLISTPPASKKSESCSRFMFLSPRQRMTTFLPSEWRSLLMASLSTMTVTGNACSPPSYVYTTHFVHHDTEVRQGRRGGKLGVYINI